MDDRPQNARTDRIIFILRYAANVAATAALIRGLESKKALNARRGKSTSSLNAVCVACWKSGFSLKTRSTRPIGRLKRG